MLKYVEKKNVERTNVAWKFVDGPKYLASNFCQSKFNNFNVFEENQLSPAQMYKCCPTIINCKRCN